VDFHLAQFNHARAVAPIDAPPMAGFIEALGRINALADAARGFVWRLEGDDASTVAAVAASDPLLILNMSVWENAESLFDYVYRGEHNRMMLRRREWFEKATAPQLVLWWIPRGHRPTVDEGFARLDLLRERGPTPEAFTFKQRFPPPRAATV
jgi:hypothetical protein